MYQGWGSEPRTLLCFCGQERQYRERYLGYNLSFALEDGNYSDCPGCGKFYLLSDLLSAQEAIRKRLVK